MSQFLQNSDEITAWLDLMNIKSYTLVPHDTYGFVVNVEGSADIYYQELTQLPVKFNRITGRFDCSNNSLTTLVGCPERVGKSFDCSHNNLTSLVGAPLEVMVDFDCSGNQLKTLEHVTPRVGKCFYCEDNVLEDLEYCPQSVGRDFYCAKNPLLGETQKIKNFKEIYAIHLKTSMEAKITKEKNHLTHIIISDLKSKNSYKI